MVCTLVLRFSCCSFKNLISVFSAILSSNEKFNSLAISLLIVSQSYSDISLNSSSYCFSILLAYFSIIFYPYRYQALKSQKQGQFTNKENNSFIFSAIRPVSPSELLKPMVPSESKTNSPPLPSIPNALPSIFQVICPSISSGFCNSGYNSISHLSLIFSASSLLFNIFLIYP